MTTFTSPQDGTTLDSFTQSVDNNQHGNDNTLYIGSGSTNTHRIFIKFDLSSIPTSAIVTSASLWVYVSGGVRTYSRTTQIYRQKRDWVESQVLWNVYKSGNSWQTAGGFGSNDCEQTTIGTGTVSADGWKEFSLTASLIQEMINGTFTNNGFMMKLSTEIPGQNDYSIYSSSENATSTNRPYLVVTYILGGQVIIWSS